MIKKGVQFSMSREFVERAPADVVRRAAAEHAGALLTEMLLDPQADPFNDLKLRAERLVQDEFRLDAYTFRVVLTCADTPREYVPVAPRHPAQLFNEPKGIDL